MITSLPMRVRPYAVMLGLLVCLAACDTSIGELERIPDAETLLRRQPVASANTASIKASGEGRLRTGNASFFMSGITPCYKRFTVLMTGGTGPAEEHIGGISTLVPDSVLRAMAFTGDPARVYGSIDYYPIDGPSRENYSMDYMLVFRRADSLRVEGAFASLVRHNNPDCYAFCSSSSRQYVEGRFHAIPRR